MDAGAISEEARAERRVPPRPLGSLDRNEIKQLMQIMEPRRGITNEELDAAMVEIDTSVRESI